MVYMVGNPTAAFIVIGNEILSGRTQDKNINFLANGLNALGIRFKEVRIIPDIEQTIIDTVNELRKKFTYVFTSGGIGPTHDDITSESIAKAFGVELLRNPDAVAALEAHYENSEQNLNEARLRMANIPDGATLIRNPISGAPGYRIENVFVMAGVPSIMQAMFDNIKNSLQGGEKIIAREITTHLTEGTIASALSKIQSNYPNLDLGSYPFIHSGKLGVCLVVRGIDKTEISKCEKAITKMIEELGGSVIEAK